MVQDVPNLRAHVESRAQRPLWVLVALIALGAAASYAFSGPGNRFVEPVRRSSMIDAAELFADGRADAAISHLNSDELRDAPEGALLRAIIHYYRGSEEKLETIRGWLEEAAEADIPGADTMLGWVLLGEKDCASCVKEAEQWFEHALTGRADRDARLGLATALARLGHAEEARGHCDALLAEEIKDTVRLRALTLRASVTRGPNAASAYAEEAARQGFAEAQFALWRDHLPKTDRQARLWLAMAALQGHKPAIEEFEASPLSLPTYAAERLLMAMADDPGTALGHAALWCGTQRGREADWLKACRITSLEAHLGCTLPESVIDTLGLHGFEQSEAYSRCRKNALVELR